MSRRTTLGPISQSAVNVRAGLAASRPSLGPARVSNTHGDYPAKSRASIGVPAPKVSIGMAAPSRRSSVQPRGSSITTGRAVDPRNISDKQFMNASIRTLVDYLTQHNFDHAISPKILTRPAVKDFQNIVMFLFRQIDPNFNFTGKFEDEVVAFFKQLGYPCTISKANIAAVGSPHAWPSLLASLMWLIEILTYDEVVACGSSQEEPLGDIDDPAASEKAFYAYLSSAYGLFMTGDDGRYAEMEEQFVNSFESKNVLIREQIEELERTNEALNKEIAQVETRRTYLPELEAKKRDYLNDLGKFEQLVEELEKHREKLDSQLRKREMELERLTSDVNVMEQDVDVLRNRIATQEISPEDVKRMVAERERLHQAQEQASENRQALQRRVWESEMALRDRVQALEDCARAYNTVAEDLKLIPSSAKHARGKNLTLDVDVRAKKRDALLKTDIRGDILPALQGLKAEFIERSGALRKELLTTQDSVDDIQLKMNTLQEEQAMYESKLRRAEDACRRDREMYDQMNDMHAKEMEAVEVRLGRLRENATEEARAAAASRRAAEARATRDVRRREHNRKKQEIIGAIMDVASACAGHRQLVTQRLGEVRELFEQRLESVIAGSAAETVAAFVAMAESDATNLFLAVDQPTSRPPESSTNQLSHVTGRDSSMASTSHAQYIPTLGAASQPHQSVSTLQPIATTMTAPDVLSLPIGHDGVSSTSAADVSVDAADIELSLHDHTAPSMISEPFDIRVPSAYNFAGLLEACAKDDKRLLPEEYSRR